MQTLNSYLLSGIGKGSCTSTPKMVTLRTDPREPSCTVSTTFLVKFRRVSLFKSPSFTCEVLELGFGGSPVEEVFNVYKHHNQGLPIDELKHQPRSTAMNEHCSRNKYIYNIDSGAPSFWSPGTDLCWVVCVATTLSSSLLHHI